MKDWIGKNTNGLFGLIGLVVIVIGIDLMPQWLGEKIGTLTERVIADPEGVTATALTLIGCAATVIAALRAAWQRDPNSPAPKPQRLSGTDGSTSIHTIAYVALGALFMLAGCALIAGCGASAIRTHATIADGLHRGVELAGGAITDATRMQLEHCDHDDGAVRTDCVNRVERVTVAAAALRDAMIAPVDTYRALVLTSCGIDPSDVHAGVPDDCPDPAPTVLEQLEQLAPIAMHDAPALVAALRALGAPVPAGLFAGGQ